jgi:hypothetical protein
LKAADLALNEGVIREDLKVEEPRRSTDAIASVGGSIERIWYFEGQQNNLGELTRHGTLNLRGSDHRNGRWTGQLKTLIQKLTRQSRNHSPVQKKTSGDNLREIQFFCLRIVQLHFWVLMNSGPKRSSVVNALGFYFLEWPLSESANLFFAQPHSSPRHNFYWPTQLIRFRIVSWWDLQHLLYLLPSIRLYFLKRRKPPIHSVASS